MLQFRCKNGVKQIKFGANINMAKPRPKQHGHRVSNYKFFKIMFISGVLNTLTKGGPFLFNSSIKSFLKNNNYGFKDVVLKQK